MQEIRIEWHSESRYIQKYVLLALLCISVQNLSYCVTLNNIESTTLANKKTNVKINGADFRHRRQMDEIHPQYQNAAKKCMRSTYTPALDCGEREKKKTQQYKCNAFANPTSFKT